MAGTGLPAQPELCLSVLEVQVGFPVHHSKINSIFLLKPGIPVMRYLSQTVPRHLNTHTTSQFLSQTPLEESCNCLYYPEGFRFRLLPSTSSCTPSQKESSHESREDSLCSILAHYLPPQKHFTSTLPTMLCCHTQLSP